MASLKTVAQNKKAHHDYFIEESFEAGYYGNKPDRRG